MAGKKSRRKSKKRAPTALRKYMKALKAEKKNPVMKVPRKKLTIRNASSVTLIPMRNGAVGVKVVRKKR